MYDLERSNRNRNPSWHVHAMTGGSISEPPGDGNLRVNGVLDHVAILLWRKLRWLFAISFLED